MDIKYVAIHTINDDTNFGNRLQNFALQKVISDHGMPALTLQDSGSRNNYYGLWAELRYVPGVIHARAFKKAISNKASSFRKELLNQKRQAIFQKFTKRYVPKFPNGNPDAKNIKKVVIGSDQIWNPYFRANLDYDIKVPTLDVEKISYAASIGISDIDSKYDVIFESGIKNLQSVSVREQSAKEYLQNFVTDAVEVVLDPTMLLKKESWSRLADLSQVSTDRSYVATYFLGNPTSEQRDYINSFARDRNLSVIKLNDIHSDLFAKIGPLEFLRIIRDADTVFADSYHAAVFSIIFEKNFELFNRQDDSIVRDMNTRMKTLFAVFNLDSRLHSESEITELEEVNFDEINTILQHERSRSLSWLFSALGDK